MQNVSGDPSADDPPSGVDLYDVARCPCGFRCESCGIESTDLAVFAVTMNSPSLTPIVACLTMCPRCAESGVEPPIHVGTAARLVAQHAVHVARLSALRDDEPQFEELTGADRDKADAEYRRIWGGGAR